MTSFSNTLLPMSKADEVRQIECALANRFARVAARRRHTLSLGSPTLMMLWDGEPLHTFEMETLDVDVSLCSYRFLHTTSTLPGCLQFRSGAISNS